MSSFKLSTSSPSTSSQTFTLLLFGPAATFAGDVDSLTFPAPMDLGALFGRLEALFPGFKEKVLRCSGVSVNLEYVDFVLDDGDGGAADQKRVVRAGDEVAIIPPVSSG